MYDLTNINTLHRIFEECGFNLKKGLGQNFIVDSTVCPRIAENALIDGRCVLEIGPGAGVLTCELAKRAKKVLCVEVDTKLKPILEKTLADFNNTEVYFGDVMKVNLAELIREKFGNEQICVCANLPYYITSPIIMMLLESGLPIESITVMVQKEAAQRLCAEMGTRDCGAVTAAVRYYSNPTLLFKVGKGSFLPPPKVDSAVIRLDLKSEDELTKVDRKSFFKVIRAAFSMRRKTLANCLASHLDGCDKQSVTDAFIKCGIDSGSRAEQLSMDEFYALTEALMAKGDI